MEQKAKKQKSDIGAKLDKLAEIVAWFDEQKEVDVERGLEKAREGAALIKELKEKMKDVENEFREIKKDLQSVDEE
jgi:exonuclease VII small subunit